RDAQKGRFKPKRQNPPLIRGTRGSTAGGATTLIEAVDVRYSYPSKVEALKGVSLTVKDGEFVAIMGQNGAGKSTFVKHFNGLLKPSSGTVKIDGVETTKSSVAALARNVGFVFQNPDHQLFSESVEEEIAFALKNFGFEQAVI